MTMQLNTRLHLCAQNLQDQKPLAKLSAGYVVAQELKYHGAFVIVEVQKLCYSKI
jgi:hypothetical protein